MSDADNAEHGKKPQSPSLPASVEPSSDHGRSKPFTRAFFCACLVALVWMFVLLGFIVAWTSVASTIVATLVSVASAFIAFIGVFQPPKFPAIAPKVTRGVVTAILMVEFSVSAGWAGWSFYQANRTIDVLSTIMLDQNVGVLPDGHATLDLALTAQRDTIILVFRIVDHNSNIGSCVPSTSLSVTPDMAGNRGGTVFTSSGAPTSVDLPAGVTKLHLDIAVMNTRGDQNCAVDLRVDSAKLQNR